MFFSLLFMAVGYASENAKMALSTMSTLHFSDDLDAHRFRKKRHPRPLPKYRQKPARFPSARFAAGNDCGGCQRFFADFDARRRRRAAQARGREHCRDRRADRRGQIACLPAGGRHYGANARQAADCEQRDGCLAGAVG